MTDDLMSSPEDDIFVDKGELLREEYANLNNEIEAISEEILDIQSELILTEHSIQEQEVKNNEYNSYLEKKQSKRLKNTITLEDYYLFTVNELERDRDEMLTMFAKKKSELQDVLLQEKKLLKHVKEELVSTADIQISNKLIVEHVNKICKENEELYKDILNKSELIKAMEAEKSNLEKKNEEVRHNQVFSKDLEYVEYKRREGLSQLKSLSTQK
ncbi:unnamed protein product [Schistosoma margrebowiei]|uniref:DUF4515 domain-containing protein n=1 Tax=Schistosoma margrebowiei TaxID=48269 RepID=A0AA85AK78_9TREM|nr:unnamed protein product [Schistosoma margrebowiei]